MKRILFSTSIAAAMVIAGAGISNAADEATITGKVVLKGTPPAEVDLKEKMTQADPACAAMHTEAVTTHRYEVGKDGGLANVFVYVKDGLAGKTFEVPKTPVVLDQRGCLYHPYVFGIQVGQPLEIINSDDTSHNVHIMPTANEDKNIGQPMKGMKSTHKFTKPEVMVKFKCDVHPWMFAYAGVVSHPFYAVTGEDGTFKITGLPPGEYTLEFVHLKAGTKTEKVKAGAGETKVDVTFEAK